MAAHTYWNRYFLKLFFFLLLHHDSTEDAFRTAAEQGTNSINWFYNLLLDKCTDSLTRSFLKCMQNMLVISVRFSNFTRFFLRNFHEMWISYLRVRQTFQAFQRGCLQGQKKEPCKHLRAPTSSWSLSSAAVRSTCTEPDCWHQLFQMSNSPLDLNFGTKLDVDLLKKSQAAVRKGELWKPLWSDIPEANIKKTGKCNRLWYTNHALTRGQVKVNILLKCSSPSF